MPHPPFDHIDVYKHNRLSWDRQAAQHCEWSQPVSAEQVAAARNGSWQLRLTPGALPAGWLDEVRGLRILCLASGGGQQAPILAAAGASVTVFDASDLQLQQDRMVAQRDGLELNVVQGDMRDLSAFENASFDLVFHPISNLYVPDIRPVWRECFRVLRSGGTLLSSFYNPVVFVGDRDPAYAEQGLIRPRFSLPYSDLEHLDAQALADKQLRGEALVFGHSLSEQIGGQLDVGFVLTGFYEDHQPHPRFVIDRYLPTFLASRATKPG
jgi:SAM-dependent methyltransferase